MKIKTYFVYIFKTSELIIFFFLFFKQGKCAKKYAIIHNLRQVLNNTKVVQK